MFKYLTEPELVKKWVGGVIDIRPISGRRNEVGAKSEIVVEENGSRLVMEDEVLRSTQNESLTVKLDSRMFDVRSVYSLQNTNGSTHLQYKMLATHKGIFRLMAPFISGQIRDKLNRDVQRLKKVIETDSK